jgi:hypothetical protein
MSSKRPPTSKRGGPPDRTQQGRGRGGRGRGPERFRPARSTPGKFHGNCAALHDQIFDCSDYRQADTFVTTLKRVSEYVGAQYKNGGDIRSSIVHELKITIPIPSAPTIADPTALTPQEEVDKIIFKGELDAYVKRKNVLEESIMKTYSLVLGQCTDLLQSKLKQQNAWEAISEKQDAIALIGLIKTITFRFEDQKFLPLALYQSKAHLYNLRQGDMTNTDYLQRFQNLVDVATAYNGQLHDQAIVDIVTERLHPSASYDSLNADQKRVVQTASSELYLATMFIRQSDRRRYGKLSEDLENSFTKGNDDYPDNLVSAYHLINEYKCWNPIRTAPEASSVAFATTTKRKSQQGQIKR